LSLPPCEPLIRRPRKDADPTIQGLVGRTKKLEQMLSATQSELKTTQAGLEAATQTADLNKTKLAEVTKLLETEVIKFGSAVRFQVKDEPRIIGTSGGSAVIGTTVDVGVREGNDNWFRVIRRP
jgi:hypothetical protein